MTKQEKWNLEQCMVYLFKKASQSPTMRLGKKRKQWYWDSMCTWVDEYIEKVKQSENIELRNE